MNLKIETTAPDAERVGHLRRYTERAARVLELREELTLEESKLEREIDRHGGDPLGVLPLWSSGRIAE
jgi:hypothetical protein